MKKLVTVLLIGGMLVCFAGCSKKEENPIGNMPNPFYKEETEGNQMNTQIPNPWIEVETMEEAIEKAGFDF
ncbi:MAG: hypothetical protein HUJ58_01170, partial [Erysipelotrichaceae bacterium]|nr:hypothetical protein [Erysipelotrichaceae bacterium]